MNCGNFFIGLRRSAPSRQKANIGCSLTCRNTFSLTIRHLIHCCSWANRLARMRMETNRARGTFQQLRLATQRRLTWRLYSLYYRIETLKSRLEVCWTSLLEYA